MDTYKIGDKVKIVKNRVFGMNVNGDMDKYLGSIMTIKSSDGFGNYKMMEDYGYWSWNDNMIEGCINIIKKSDLQNGDIVTYREKYVFSRRIVQNGKILYLNDFKNLSMALSDYDENLMALKNPDFDIVKVYRPETEETFYTEKTKEAKEMTVAEIERELGYQIKVVKEDK